MQLLCGYEVLGVVATGGFSTVYHVRESEPPYREFAAKRFKSYRDNKVFEQEVNALAAVNGLPNCQQFFRAIREQDTLVILCHYLAGESLKAKIDRDGPLTESQGLAIAKAMASVVQGMRERGIRHLDIKPSNILIDGNQYTLTDFGIAEPDTVHRCELIKSDFNYTAPERYQGIHTASSDIYSLGVSLYQLIFGTLPFDLNSQDQSTKLLRHVSEKLLFPPSVTPIVRDLISAMMTRDHRKRPTPLQIIEKVQQVSLGELKRVPHIRFQHPELPNSSEEENLSRAARLGVPFAQYRYALMLNKSGAKKESINWYEKAARQGFTRAQNNLALFHRTRGELDKALDWYLMAANTGNAFAQYNLARLYEEGNSAVEQDAFLARHWFEEAAKHGHEHAQNILGNLHETQGDLKEAYKLYEHAAYTGLKAAQYNLGRLFEKGVCAKLGTHKPDYDCAGFWYKQASEQGHTRAHERLHSLGQPKPIVSRSMDTDDHIPPAKQDVPSNLSIEKASEAPQTSR
ncbi:MAG: Sel1-like repeat-containing protein kinase family protein [Pontibacterium sp.]